MMKTCLILLLVVATITTAMHTENHQSQSKRNETEPCSTLGPNWSPFPGGNTCTKNKDCQGIIMDVGVKCEKTNGVCCMSGGGDPPTGPQLANAASYTCTTLPCKTDENCSGGDTCKTMGVCVRRKRNGACKILGIQCTENYHCPKRAKCETTGVCCQATGCDLQPDPSGGPCGSDQECVANFGPGSVCNMSIPMCFFCDQTVAVVPPPGTDACKALGQQWNPFPTNCTENANCTGILPPEVEVACDQTAGRCCMIGGGGPFGGS